MPRALRRIGRGRQPVGRWRRRPVFLAVAVAVAALALANAGPIGPAAAAPVRAPAPAVTAGPDVHVGPGGETDVATCGGPVAPGRVRCFARVRTDAAVGRAAAAAAVAGNAAVDPPGYGPRYLQSAYNAPSPASGAGRGQTVAIVDAFDDPSAETDLAVYRAQFGLPACTTGNGCFRKVDQNGGTNYPAPDAGWSEEISLDVDMVSALCPNCSILLVEAASNNTDDLGVAVNRAVALGANVVSNSYGGPEYWGEQYDDASYFTHPGVAIVASSGDDGYGVQFPASSPAVVAVGGTTLHQATNTGTRNATETAWGIPSGGTGTGAGSGCSTIEPKPGWQQDQGCAHRTVADVSAVADPATGVSVYSQGGWRVFGGTSAAAPIVGAMYALAGNPGGTGTSMASLPYANRSALNDVTSGVNGTCAPSPGYWCSAGPGYDGPTGLGTPNGTGAFSVRNPTITALAGAPAPVQVGQTLTLTATVTPVSGPGTPTGVVAFSDGTTSLGTAPVSGGQAALAVMFTTIGDHRVTAAYGGDPTFAASTSGVFTEKVYTGAPAPPVWTADSPPTAATVGTPYSYQFGVTSNPPSDFTVASGNLPAGLSLTASGLLSGTPTATGPWTFTVSAANGIGVAAASPTITVTVNPAPVFFEDLGPALAAGSAPATTSWGPGRIDVAIRGTDSRVYHKWYSGGWSGWEPLGGQTPDNPAVVAWATGRLDVFVRGTDNQLWHRWYAGGWSAWEPLGGTLKSAPTVTTWGPGRLDVFARGSSDQLIHKWYGGSWSGWESLGGGLSSAPSAAAWSAGRVDVVARGTDNAVWHRWYQAGWSGWETLGGAPAADATGAPDVSSWGPGRLDIFVEGADGWIDHRWYAQGWSAWNGFGGYGSGAPAAVSWAPGRTDLFVNGLTTRTGTTGDLMHTWWTG